MQKLKTLDSSVHLPLKGSTGLESQLFQKKNCLKFTEDKLNVPKRSISEIRFDDTKFWMEVSVVSYSPSLRLIEYYDSSSGKV